MALGTLLHFHFLVCKMGIKTTFSEDGNEDLDEFMHRKCWDSAWLIVNAQYMVTFCLWGKEQDRIEIFMRNCIMTPHESFQKIPPDLLMVVDLSVFGRTQNHTDCSFKMDREWGRRPPRASPPHLGYRKDKRLVWTTRRHSESNSSLWVHRKSRLCIILDSFFVSVGVFQKLCSEQGCPLQLDKILKLWYRGI